MNTTVPERPVVPASGRRLAAAAMAMIGGVLSGFSAFLAWWTVVIPGFSSVSFLPGNSFTILVYADYFKESIPYASVAWFPLEALYVSVFALAISLLVLGALGGVLMVLTTLGRIRSAAIQDPLRNLLALAFVVSVVAVAIVPALQPTLVSRSGIAVLDLCTITTSSSGPCHSFWGSGSGASGIISWGPDEGWFIMLVAVVFFCASFLVWFLGGRRTLATHPPPASAPAVPPMQS